MKKREWYRTKYLTSEHWLALRHRKLAVGLKCQDCGGFGSDVHHVVYRKLYNARLSDLRVLCRACHELRHKRRQQSEEKLKGEYQSDWRARRKAFRVKRG